MGSEGGVEALHRVKSIDPPLWLTPSPDLSQTTRIACQYLFSCLKPFCPKSHLDTLLTQGFDAEQIWQQIDLQTEPLISGLRRDIKRFEKNPDLVSKLFCGPKIVNKKAKLVVPQEETEEEDSEDDEGFDDIEDDDEEEEEEEEEEDNGGIEDRFLKINELEDYMNKDEEKEYGVSNEKDNALEDEDDDDDEEDDEMGGFEDGSDGDEGVDELGLARYEDFFGGKKNKVSKMKQKPRNGSEDDKQDDDEGFQDHFGDNKKQASKKKSKPSDRSEDDEGEFDDQRTVSLSTHEKQLEKQRSMIEQMEKENLDPKPWLLQGEVTASKRPMNSALEANLEFEHNVRPAPVATEELHASLEEIIKKRIIENRFDDVQWASNIPSRSPKEIKELDENKSKKGLAEIYEEEYVQQTGLGIGPVSSSDELKKEAQVLFQKLCLKLDALSHFHFKPKPVIEDMSIETNVPALAMEEIAPVAVSDAAMLAPEEVFAGKGDIKEEAELTQAERKRRRAKKKMKKRKFEAEKQEKRARASTLVNNSNGKEEF